MHRDLNRFFLDVLQTTLPPKLAQFSRSTQSHVPFVQLVRFRIEMHHAIPKRSQHLHSFAIIPNSSRDSSLCFRHTAKLFQRLERIGDEVEDQQGETAVEAAIPETQLLRITNLKPNPISRWILTRCVVYVFLGWIDSTHLHPRLPFRQSESQRSGTRANVEELAAIRHIGEVQKRPS